MQMKTLLPNVFLIIEHESGIEELRISLELECHYQHVGRSHEMGVWNIAGS